jgi:1,4-dihydroxy-2-naphthoate octaprenyltransferase
MASRPATLLAAIAPVLVGSAIAVGDDVFRLDLLLVVTVAALAIQIGVNFANDVADASRGADTDARIGPTRAVSSGLIAPRQMWRGIIVVFGVAAVCGLYLAWMAGPVILVIGTLSILAALGYTNGPVPYGYYGLGEIFVFVFFGLVATVGTRFVYDSTLSRPALVGGVVMGLLAAAILVANNIRDLDTDRAAGKRTLAVIMGRRLTRWLYAAMLAAAFAILLVSVAADTFPPATLLAALAAPLAIAPLRAVWSTTSGPPLIAALQATARLQFAVALLLAIGFVV